MGSESEDMITAVVILIPLVCTAQAQNNLGDECSNQCEEGNPYHWCGKMRQDSFGRVMRCAEGTKIGQPCIDSCSSNGQSYFWCAKSLRWVEDDNNDYSSDDDWWEYCSPDNTHTRYGEPCRDECASRGYSYFWCYTGQSGSSWDYCSPQPYSAEEVITKGGSKCAGICDRMSSGYGFCEIKETRKNLILTMVSWWDYCTSPYMPANGNGLKASLWTLVWTLVVLFVGRNL